MSEIPQSGIEDAKWKPGSNLYNGLGQRIESHGDVTPFVVDIEPQDINPEFIDKQKQRTDGLIREIEDEFRGIDEYKANLTDEQKQRILDLVDKNSVLSLLADEIWSYVIASGPHYKKSYPKEGKYHLQSERMWEKTEYKDYHFQLKNIHRSLIALRLKLEHMLGEGYGVGRYRKQIKKT